MGWKGLILGGCHRQACSYVARGKEIGKFKACLSRGGGEDARPDRGKGTEEESRQ